ncbi:unnamed protein product [Ranitomeya imitator]|uniref:Metalloendopeptidase n=1 Tax=Ranitomeya imitator TaxID=111125 RepID=A0ABN9M817_9NEOB|nr:unnamed protein product [Ranitomeya imitator]
MYEPYSQDDSNSRQDPTVFEVIQAANRGESPLLQTLGTIRTAHAKDDWELIGTSNSDIRYRKNIGTRYRNSDTANIGRYLIFAVSECSTLVINVHLLLKEGDVAVDLRRNARKCNTCKWPKNANGIVPVPYTIDSQYSASEVSLINDALKEFEVMTCVQFVNRISEADYLSIEPGTGCWSYIGRILGKQTVSLARPSCMVYGVIQHEAMHNIGFFHEHTRMDRDNYIDILWQNMDKAYYSNFDVADGNTFSIPYDYASVMHC